MNACVSLLFLQSTFASLGAVENHIDSPMSAYNLSVLREHRDAATLDRGSHLSFTERSQEWVLSPDLIPWSWYFWVCLSVAPHRPLVGGGAPLQLFPLEVHSFTWDPDCIRGTRGHSLEQVTYKLAPERWVWLAQRKALVNSMKHLLGKREWRWPMWQLCVSFCDLRVECLCAVGSRRKGKDGLFPQLGPP